MKRIVILASFLVLTPVAVFFGALAGQETATIFYEEAAHRPLRAGAMLALFAGVVAMVYRCFPDIFTVNRT